MVPDESELKPPQGKFATLQEQLLPEEKALWESEQEKIRDLIEYKNSFNWDMDNLTLVCGVDLSAHVENKNLACVGLVVYNVKQKTIAYEDYEIVQINQPYVPGFLAFRQIPPLYSLFMKLKKQEPLKWPDLLITDGNGILHQNGCGLACHLGVLLKIPTIGVGKTLFFVDGLTKQKVKNLCDENIKDAKDFALLKGDSGRVWGAALRTGKAAKNPVFVSIGTKIQLETAIKCVTMISQYRVPEPVRIADKKSRAKVEEIDPKCGKKYKDYKMIYLQDL